MATTPDQIDPLLWQFLFRVAETGGFPVLALMAVFGLIWKFGLPWKNTAGATDQPDAVVEALADLRRDIAANHAKAEEHREEIKDTMAALAERLAFIEGRIGAKTR